MVTYSTSALSKEIKCFCNASTSHGYIQHFRIFFFPLFITYVFDFFYFLLYFFALYSSWNKTSTDTPGHNHYRCKKRISSSHVSPTEQSRRFGYQILLGQNQNVACIFHTKSNFLKGEEVSLIALLKECVWERESKRGSEKEKKEGHLGRWRV